MLSRVLVLAGMVLVLEYPDALQAQPPCDMVISVQPSGGVTVTVDCGSCCKHFQPPLIYPYNVRVQWATGPTTCGGPVLQTRQCTGLSLVSFDLGFPPLGARYVRIVKYCRTGAQYVDFEPLGTGVTFSKGEALQETCPEQFPPVPAAYMWGLVGLGGFVLALTFVALRRHVRA